MAVNLQFDSNHNPLEPTLVLAKKDGTKLGVLTPHSFVAKICFNTYSEMSFRVNKNETDIWDSVVDFKLLWAKEWDLWFEIYVEVDEDNSLYKNITAKSLGEAELSQIKLYDFEANTDTDIERVDYEPTVFYDDENTSTSLLHRMLVKAPHYNILYVSPSLKSIQRTFNFSDTNVYDALQDVSKEIDCYIDYTVRSDENGKPLRQFSVYDLESYCLSCGHRGEFEGDCPECDSSNVVHGYGEDTKIYVCTENLADSVNYTTNVDAVKNCFKLEAGDDLMTAAIVGCNPNGSSYLWHISEETKRDMPDELVEKLEDYDELYQAAKTTSMSINSSHRTAYNTLVTKYSSYHSLNNIPQNIIGFPGLMSSYYDTIDMKLLLQSSLMPTAEQADTSASLQAARLTGARLSPISVYDLTSASASTVDNTVLLFAKSLIDYRYQVRIASSSYNTSTHIWQGSFRVTNYYDETDTAVSSSVSITVNDNYESYVEQQTYRMLAVTSQSETDIVSLFKLSNADFKEALKKYSLNRLKSFYDACEACFNILIEQGAGTNVWNSANNDLYTDLYQPYRQKQGFIQDEITIREGEIQTVETAQEDLSTLISNVQTSLNFENYLGSTLWKVFSSYRREDTYSNSNYISDGLTNPEIFKNALDFIETANKEIYKSSVLQHSITATLRNLLVMKEFDGLTSNFEVGNWIHIRSNGVVYNLRLLDYEISFDNLENLSVTFSDVQSVANGVSDLESIAEQSRAMASSYDNVSRQAEKGNSSRSQLDGWAERGLSLTSLKILNNAESQDYVFDEHGMVFRKYRPITNDYDDKQLKIINSTIAMTDNGWVSVRTAIGEIYYIDPLNNSVKNGYGINGEVIIGKLILGEQLGIYNSGATLRFNKDGLYVSNDTVTFTANPNNLSKLFAISVSSNGSSSDVLAVTASGDLSITGQITATSGYIGGSTGWTIGSGCIYNGKTTSTSTAEGIYISPSIIYLGSGSSSLIKLEKSGKMTANNVELTGKITATEGYIGGSTGFTINSTSITNGKTAYNETSNNGVYIGTDGIGLGKGKFYVTKNGALTATDATITGTITASDGKIGGWSINSGKIYAGDGSDVKVAVMQAPSSSITWVFAAGGTSHSGYSDCPFRVNKAGDLYATSATITGSVTATSGKVGNWTINENYIGSTKTGGSFYIASASDSSSYWIRAHDAASGGGNIKFSVSKTGLLYASGATISGSITASSGDIGGWTVNSGYIGTFGSASSTFFLSESGKSAYVNAAGASKNCVFYSAGNFAVDTSGNLYASSGTFGGSLASATGTFAGSLSAATGTFAGSLSAATGTFSGSLSAATGTFAGSISSAYGTFSGGISGELKDGVTIGTNGHCTLNAYNSGHGNTGMTLSYSNTGYLRIGQSSSGEEVWLNASQYVNVGANNTSGGIYLTSRYVTLGVQTPNTGYDSVGRLYGNWYLNGTTTAVTSDKNLKNTISSIDNKYDVFFDLIRPVTFKYNNGSSNRLHTGFIAQEVCSALGNADLTTLDFGGYVVVSEDGNDVRYLRYEEFIALNTWQIQKLKARVAELERIVAGLQNT